MSTLKELKFLDIQESKNNYYCSGYVNFEFIGIENNNLKCPLFHKSFVLNGLNDNWFRRIEGHLKGLGIALKQIKVNKNKYKFIGNFRSYKAKIIYLDHNTEITEGNVWFNIHDDFNIDDVLSYLSFMYKEYNP